MNHTHSDKPKAAYLVRRDNRKRFMFGPSWTKSILKGIVNDHMKLLEHAVQLKVGSRSTLAKLKHETLLHKVQEALEGVKH